jgi:outer membrane protein
MKFVFALLLGILFIQNRGAAQEKWTLEKCVLYGMQNNISVKQADIQARLAALELKLREAAIYPNLEFSGNGGYNFGRSINPATNTYQSQGITFSNFQLQSNVVLFNWFSLKNQKEAGKLEKSAADASLDKAKSDIAMNVAVAYLQALLANEQVEISRLQIGQTFSQLEQVRKQVKAGAVPELNAVELEAQLATDSAAYIAARSTYQQNLIMLKAVINLDMAVPFEIATPDVKTIPVESLADLQPEVVYSLALANQPLQKANQLRYQAALKNIDAAKGAMFPILSAFGSIGSRYSSAFPDQENILLTPTGKNDTIGSVEIAPGVIRYTVRPEFSASAPNIPFGRQVFDVSMSQAIGLNLSIPIFRNRQLKTGYERAKLNAEGFRLQSEQDNLTLKQDIYVAYTNAVNAQQRYLAATKGVEASEKAFEFSQKRYNAGLLSSLELITNQNNVYRTRLDAVAAQYEFVFRMKLLEFYKGQGIKL